MLYSLTRTWWIGLLALALGACGPKEAEKKEEKEKAEILSFAADASTVVQGASVTLSWQTRHATEVLLLANGVTVDLGGEAASTGSVAVDLDETTDFTLRASGPGGAAEAGPVTVQVIPDGALAILAFGATPIEVDEGEAVTLSWKTANAETVTIRTSGGEALELGDASVVEGEVTIHPTMGDTYTLRASRGDESVTEDATVRIKGAPTASLQVSSDRIVWSESVTLTWATEGATSVRIERDGVSIHETTDPTGELSDEPNLSTIYRVVAARGDKVSQAAATVDVEPLILSFEVLDESPAPVGGLVQVAWNVGGATHLTLTNHGGFEQTLAVDSPSEGSLEIPMGAEGRFGLVASSGEAVGAAKETTHPVLVPPSIASFRSDRAIVSADRGEAADVTLQWSGVVGAAELLLTADTLGAIDLGAAPGESGSIRVSISEDTRFELQAINAAGEAEAAAVVAVVPFPSIDVFEASSTYVGSMEAFELSWSTSDAATIELTAGGIPVDGVTEDQLQGAITLQTPATTTYLLRATNEAMDFVEGTVSVAVGNPQNSSFEAQPAYVAVGGTVTFSWTNLGGRSLEVRDAADALVCGTTDPMEIATGGCTTTVAAEGSHAYTLTVANTVGQQDTAQISVLASAGPMISSFSAAPDAITAGELVTFSWEVVNDPDGEAPTLSLSDGTTPIDLNGLDVNQGSISVPLAEAGDHTFTFTATTAMGTKSATAQLTVHGQPAVTLVASATEYDLATPITLSWTSEHADNSLILYQQEGAGAQIPVLTVPQSQRAAGSFDVTPSGETTYRLVATNALGMEAEQEVSVTVAPPQILAFTATPDQAIVGDEITLAWTTRAATEVSLSIIDGLAVHETADPFLDISTTGTPLVPTSTCGSFAAADEGCTDLTFPAGFVFPFGGQDRTQARVMANGHLGFNFGFTANSFANQQFPSSNSYAGNAHIAPFWDDLDLGDGSMSYETGSTARGQYLVVQWTDVQFSVGVSTSSLTFQVILWDDGGFDFRYGAMTASSQSRLGGSSVTVGYQTPDRSKSHNLHFGGEGTTEGATLPGAFSNRSWSFRHVALEPNGSYTFPAPASDLTITLTARGPGGIDTEDVVVTGHPRATLAVTVPSGDRDAGEDLTLSWTTSHADALVLEDEEGASVCVVDPAQVAAGSCTFTEAVPGVYTYYVKAIGALGHEVVEEVEVQFFHPLELVDFDVSSTSVQGQESVTLIWAAAGGTSASLLANGVDVFPAGGDPNLGSLVTDPLVEATTFVFTVTAPDGRTMSLSRDVEVRTFALTLSADASSVAPGTPVVISTTVDTHVAGSPTFQVQNLPMVAVDLVAEPQAAFQDISGTGVPVTMANNYHGVFDLTAAGFSFPFGGESYSVFNFNRSGYITFHPTFDEYGYANTTLPSTSSRGQYVNLAINWGDLLLGSGKYFYEHVADPVRDYVIVQWTDVDHDDTPVQSMSFQIVLFEDGAFEYRYGDMLPTDNLVANGGRKTIGYQTPDKEDWWQFHYGAGWSGGTVSGVPGGLSHRTLRYTPFDPSQPLVVTPDDTTTYTVCATLAGYSQCQDITIEAEWEILSFEAGAEAIDPGQQVTLSWETKNAEVLSLTANGIDIPLSQSIWGLGSYVASPTVTTTYVLTLESLGRTKTETVTVEVRTFSLQFNASQTSGLPGDSVTISWNLTSFGTDAPGFTLPVFEIDAVGSPYVDISEDPGVVEIFGAGVDDSLSTHTFASGFLFPFDGVNQGSVKISSNGYLSFDTSTSTTSAHLNTSLPNSATTERRVHIAPFWDDLATRNSGRVHAVATGTGSYIVQWTHVSKITGSSSSTTSPSEYDLNFQVELYADGSFEFRFGTMDNHTASASNCHPTSDCVGDANGGSATIGYQNTTGTKGSLLHFGGGSQSSSQRPFEGGLENRSFFIPADASGSITFPLKGSRDYTLCAWLDGYETCETISVTMPAP